MPKHILVMIGVTAIILGAIAWEIYTQYKLAELAEWVKRGKRGALQQLLERLGERY